MGTKHFEADEAEKRLVRRVVQVAVERFPEQICDMQGIKREPWGETDTPPPLKPDENRMIEDILMVHTRGNKLRLQQLYENINTFDAIHDVLGIVQYLDREASADGDVVFREFFEPRYTDYAARTAESGSES